MSIDTKVLSTFIIHKLEEFKDTGLIDESMEINEECNLIGSNRIIKSRTFVELMLSIEEFLDDEYSSEFDWTSDRAMSSKRSPFLTVSTLVEFIQKECR